MVKGIARVRVEHKRTGNPWGTGTVHGWSREEFQTTMLVEISVVEKNRSRNRLVT
jgi:hypothetical protein